MRQPLLSVLARCGVLEREDAEALGTSDHGGGFSLDPSVRIEADDRLGLGAGGSVSMMLTPIELIERLAALDSHTAPAGC